MPCINKKNKIILVNTRSDTYRRPEENLGLAYLRSYLEKKDIIVIYIDGYLENLNNRRIMERIKREKEIMLVGIALYINSRRYVYDLAAKIKKYDSRIKICAGGHMATFSDKEILNKNPDIDYVVRGEGEPAFYELYQKLRAQKPVTNVKNLAYRGLRGKIISNPCRPLIDNLDILPFPDRSYAQTAASLGALTHISGSRGCYGNCSFCSINTLYRLSPGELWRGRGAKSIADEFEYLVGQYGLKTFKFVDDSFFGPGKNWRGRPFEIAAEIIKRKLNIKYRISARVNNIDLRLFKMLKKSGLYAISLGVESATTESLEIFNKGITPAAGQKAINILTKLKIRTLVGFIGFEPYLDFAGLKKNYAFLEKNSHCIFDIISKPLFVHPNDPIKNRLQDDGLITGRKFPNYSYRFVDHKVARCYNLIKYYNCHNSCVYYEITDPLSSPHIMTTAQEEKIYRLYRNLRTIDLKIFKYIIDGIEKGQTDREIKKYLNAKIKKLYPLWEKTSVSGKLILNNNNNNAHNKIRHQSHDRS